MASPEPYTIHFLGASLQHTTKIQVVLKWSGDAAAEWVERGISLGLWRGTVTLFPVL